MFAILVSQNSALLRHLSATPFRQLDLDVHVATTGDDVLAIADKVKLAVAILDAEMPGISGYSAAQQLKQRMPECRVVLILGKRISSVQMRQVTEAGCDEILIAPMSVDELYDVVSLQLGLPRRGNEPFTVSVAEITSDGDVPLECRVTNLSVDGIRLVVPGPFGEDRRLRLTITPEGGDVPLSVKARVVWAQVRNRTQGQKTTVGASFEDVDEETRARLSRLTQWDILDEPNRIRVVVKGDITEASSFDDLAQHLVGRVDFDLAQVAYINSLGVREWIGFLRKANIQGYELHACSVPFTLQAAMIPSMVGRGTVVSFFAPYFCESCGHHADKLLQSAAVLAANNQPPVFQCPKCSGKMELDDLPERYLAFLEPEDIEDSSD